MPNSKSLTEALIETHVISVWWMAWRHSVADWPSVWGLSLRHAFPLPVTALSLWLRRGHGTAYRHLTTLSLLASFRRQLKTELFVRSLPDLDSSVCDCI